MVTTKANVSIVEFYGLSIVRTSLYEKKFGRINRLLRQTRKVRKPSNGLPKIVNDEFKKLYKLYASMSEGAKLFRSKFHKFINLNDDTCFYNKIYKKILIANINNFKKECKHEKMLDKRRAYRQRTLKYWHNRNPFKVLYVNDEDGSEEEQSSQEEDIVSETIINKPKKNTWFIKESEEELLAQIAFNHPVKDEQIMQRDELLSAKLRSKILNMTVKRTNSQKCETKYCNSLHYLVRVFKKFNTIFEDNVLKYYNEIIQGIEIATEPVCEVECQMDVDRDATGAGDIVDKDVRSNVVLTNVESVETATTIEVDRGDFFIRASSSDVIFRDDRLSDRWMMACKFVWDQNSTWATDLCTLDLPGSILSECKNSPNAALFLQHAYFNSDIVIKIHLNTMPLNLGSLIGFWYYSSKFDKQASNRVNKYSAVQLPHCFINASDSNDIIMRIPFRCYKSLLSMYKRKDDANCAHLGTFYLRVFNQLQPDKTCAKLQINGVVYISFENSKFTGLIGRDEKSVVETQMMPAIQIKKAVNLASDTLDMLMPDPNRDNPIAPIVPTVVAPQPCGNWSSGNNDIDLTNPMRLIPTGQTPHPVGSSTSVDEMTIDYIKSKEGFLKTVDWTMNHAFGTLLATFFASPFQDCYASESITDQYGNKVECQVLTPVHNLAQMKQFWRGGLELTIRIINNMFQKGSLAVIYIPRLPEKNSTTSLENLLRENYHTVIDIGEQHEFKIRIPYLADKPFWPRYEDFDTSNKITIDSPGYIYVSVLNQIVVPCATTVDKVRLNFFLNGAPDFELSVPCNPSYGLSFDCDVRKDDSAFVAPNVSYKSQALLGNWRMLPGHTIIFRYGDGSDHITQWDNIQKHKIYSLTVLDVPQAETYIKGTIYVIKRASSGPKRELISTAGYIKYICQLDAGDGFKYATPFIELDHAKQYIASNHDNSFAINIDYSDASKKIAENWGNTVFSEVTDEIKKIEDTYVFEEDCETQMDGISVISMDSCSLRTTSDGKALFGERFCSLKDDCRRYQRYCIARLDKKFTSYENMDQFSLLIPILYSRPRNNYDNNQANLVRDGIIPYTASAFRFARGGLRFRLIFKNVLNGIVTIQHMPTHRIKSNDVEVIKSAKTHHTVLQNGDALVVQDLGMNKIVSFEIPFYCPTNLSLLQCADWSQKTETLSMSLGSFAICIDSMVGLADTQALVDVFYSLADDTKFSCFVGFPYVFALNAFQPKTIETQGVLDIFKSTNEEQTANSGGVGGFIERLAEKHGKAVGEAATTKLLEESKEVINSQPSKEEEPVSNAITGWFNKMIAGQTDEIKQVAISSFGQVAQCWANPSIKTFAIAFATILCNAGVMAYSFIFSFINGICKLYKRIYNLFKVICVNDVDKTPSKTEKGGGGIEPQSDVEPEIALTKEEKATLLSTMFSAIISTTSGIFTCKAKNMPDFCKDLCSGIYKGARLSNTLNIFFRNNLSVFEKVWNWIMSKVFPKNNFVVTAHTDKEHLAAWMKDVEEIRLAYAKGTLENDKKLLMKTMDVCVIAEALKVKYTHSDNGLNRSILTPINKILDIRTELYGRLIMPPVRFEPFVLTLAGDTKVGKSHFTQHLIPKLAAAIGIKTDGKLIYTRTAGVDFWNELRNEPFCLYDDFAQIVESSKLANTLTELFCLKSTAVFNPNQAALEDKNRVYNPLGVVLCQNIAFPAYNILASNEAMLRRRDIVVNISVKPEYLKNKQACEFNVITDVPEDVRSKYGHLQFSVYSSVVDETKGFVKEKLSVEEFLKFITCQFKNYYMHEIKEYRKRLQELSKFSPSFDDTLDVTKQRYAEFLDRITTKEVDRVFKDVPTFHDKLILARSFVEFRLFSYLQNFKCSTEEEKILFEEQLIDMYVSSKQITWCDGDYRCLPVCKCSNLPVKTPQQIGLEEAITKKKFGVNSQIDAVMPFRKMSVNSKLPVATFKKKKDDSILHKVQVIGDAQEVCGEIEIEPNMADPDCALISFLDENSHLTMDQGLSLLKCDMQKLKFPVKLYEMKTGSTDNVKFIEYVKDIRVKIENPSCQDCFEDSKKNLLHRVVFCKHNFVCSKTCFPTLAHIGSSWQDIESFNNDIEFVYPKNFTSAEKSFYLSYFNYAALVYPMVFVRFLSLMFNYKPDKCKEIFAYFGSLNPKCLHLHMSNDWCYNLFGKINNDDIVIDPIVVQTTQHLKEIDKLETINNVGCFYSKNLDKLALDGECSFTNTPSVLGSCYEGSEKFCMFRLPTLRDEMFKAYLNSKYMQDLIKIREDLGENAEKQNFVYPKVYTSSLTLECVYPAQELKIINEMTKFRKDMAACTENINKILIEEDVKSPMGKLKLYFLKVWRLVVPFFKILKDILKLASIFFAIGAFTSLGSNFISNVYNGGQQPVEQMSMSDIKNKYVQGYEYVKSKTTNLVGKMPFIGVKHAHADPQMAYEKYRVPAAAAPHMPIRPQIASDVQANMVRSLKRNTFCLERHCGSRINRMRCVGLVDRKFLFIDHYYYYCLKEEKEPVTYFYVYNGVSIHINFADIKFVPINNSCLLIGDLPNHVDYFKDITKYFIKSTQSSSINREFLLFEKEFYIQGSDVRQDNVVLHSFFGSYRQNLIVPGNDNYSGVKVDLVYQYPLSKKGLCGAILMTTANVNNPIIGIHFAGEKNGTWGFSEAICYETIMSSLSVFKSRLISSADIEFQLDDVSGAKVSLEGVNVSSVGVVQNIYAHNDVGVTRQQHSVCYEQFFESTYDYPVLSDKDKRPAKRFSPMYEGVVFHGYVPKHFKYSNMEIIFDYYQKKLNSVVKPARTCVGKLDLQEAICGNELASYDAMEFDTSEGFPHVARRPKTCRDKRWLFDLTVEKNGYVLHGIDELLSEQMKFKEEQRVNGIVPVTVFTDCLKDIKLPAEKALVPGKTRIFSISPVDFTIQFRQLFLDFTVAFQNARFAIDHAVGINCSSMEWTQLAMTLRNNSENIIVADYQKFGPSLSAQVCGYVFKLIAEWYKYHGDSSEDNYISRIIMGEEIRFSYHLMFNLLYKVYCGAPSGSPITTILNTLVNFFYIMNCWLELGFDTTAFEDNVKLITYGDDLIMSVKTAYIDYFNCKTIGEILIKYGIVLTDANKTSEIVKYRNIFDPDVTFLKRNFVKHPFRYHVIIGPLNIRAVKEISNWIFKSDNKIMQSIVACQSALESSYEHGKEFYEDYRNKVIKYWAETKGIFVWIPSWNEVDSRIFPTMDESKIFDVECRRHPG